MSKRNKLNKWILGGAGALIAATATSAFCADTSDALIDALIKKGILTEKEAQEIQAESTTNITALPATKWKLSDAIKSIGLFGDVRMRYEYRAADNPKGALLTTGDTYRRERFRYALRFGVRGDLYDNWSYGVRLETSANPRSPWVTFADDTGKASSGGVSGGTPSDKTSDFLNIGQVYMTWRPTEWYEMTVGRMPMPLYITPMVWDSDINPEGAFEKIKFSTGNVDWFADLGQFDYQNVNPANAGDFPSSDTFLLAWQLGANVKLGKDALKVAPVVYTYSGGGGGAGLTNAFVGQGNNVGGNPNTVAFNQNGINDLLVIEVPGEFSFPIITPMLGPLEGRLFGDIAYNVKGNDRARAAFKANNAAFPTGAPVKGEDKAYQVGFGIGNEGPVYGPTQGLVYGSTSKKGTWEARCYWQHIEQYALDVNLIDSDFFEGRANLQGFYTSFAYSFTDAIIGTARYGYATRINNNLGTGGNNLDLPQINPIKNYNVVQLDLTLRF